MKKPTKEIIAENLQRQLRAADMTQTDLANAIGVTPAAVSTWIKGIAAPHADTVDKICSYFKIPTDELWKDTSDILAKSKTIPIYNSIYKKQYFDVSNIERYLAVDQTIKADFGIVVYSDSMSEAGIEPADVAFFKKDFNFVNGRIYAVWIKGEESVILKRVFSSNGVYVLNSENKHIPPIVIGTAEADIMGELFGIYKRWKWDNEKI